MKKRSCIKSNCYFNKHELGSSTVAAVFWTGDVCSVYIDWDNDDSCITVAGCFDEVIEK